MTNIDPALDEEQGSFGSVLTMSPDEYDALQADAEAWAAVKDLPDGVMIGIPATVTDVDDNVISYQCAHSALNVEDLTEVLDDPELLTEVKRLKAAGGKDWAEKARDEASKRSKAKSKTERAAKLERAKGRAEGKAKPKKKAAVKKR